MDKKKKQTDKLIGQDPAFTVGDNGNRVVKNNGQFSRFFYDYYFFFSPRPVGMLARVDAQYAAADPKSENFYICPWSCEINVENDDFSRFSQS